MHWNKRPPCVKGAVERSEAEGLFAAYCFYMTQNICYFSQSLRVCFANSPPFTQGRLLNILVFHNSLCFLIKYIILPT